eukprot:COSAG02_NODE_56348_length_286_cov_0.556150_1_plen_44_part_10
MPLLATTLVLRLLPLQDWLVHGDLGLVTISSTELRHVITGKSRT